MLFVLFVQSIFGSLKNYLSGPQTDPSQNKGSEPSASTSTNIPASPSEEWKKGSFNSSEFQSGSSGNV